MESPFSKLQKAIFRELSIEIEPKAGDLRALVSMLDDARTVDVRYSQDLGTATIIATLFRGGTREITVPAREVDESLRSAPDVHRRVRVIR